MLQPYYNKGALECGLDEAGRGCLAGSVYAAAVILPNEDIQRTYQSDKVSASFDKDTLRIHSTEKEEQRTKELNELFSLLNDSKQISDKQRRKLRPLIEKYALAFAVCEVTNEEIDKINILESSILAMNRAVKQLNIPPEFLLVDGNRFHTDTGIPFKTVIKGDATFMSIAAASVLAKTYRDDAMIALSREFPQYNWQKNKGYPTKDHRNAIRQFGITTFHRKTFNLLGEPTLF